MELESRHRELDGRGNRTSESFGGRTRQFTVDSADRLIASKEWDGHLEVWKLLPDGAKSKEAHFTASTPFPSTPAAVDALLTAGTPSVSRQFSYGPLGALESITEGNSPILQYVVDANGQVTSRTSNGSTVNFQWDVDGRLVSAATPGPTSQLTATYVYDGLGMRRRAQVTLTPPTGPPSTTTRAWNWAGPDGEEEVAEEVGGVSNTTTSVGPFRVGEGVQRFGHDALGSVTSQNDGLTTTYADFSVWGQLSATGTLASSAGFAGGRVESALGLNYNRRRWQDPVSGVFLSRDDLGAGNYLASPNGLGPWSYAANNPGRFLDPDGRSEFDGLELPDPVQLTADWFSDVLGGLAGGHGTNPCAGSGNSGPECYAIHTGPKNGVGGLWGGFWRELSFRTIPIEEEPSVTSLVMMETSAGFVPLLGPGQRAFTGQTVTTRELDASEQALAAGEFVLDAIPVASLALKTPTGRMLVLTATLRTASIDERFLSVAQRLREPAAAIMSVEKPTMVSQLYRATVEANVFRNTSTEQERFAAFLKSTQGISANESLVPVDLVASAERQRLPQNGVWSGVPGESNFTPSKASKLPEPDDPYVVDLAPGESIPFRNGRPDFSKWAWDQFDVPGLTGGPRDRTLMAKALAERYNLLGASGTPTAAAGLEYMERIGVVPHHAGGTTVQLVPHGLHGSSAGRVGVPHIGGASELRNTIETIK